MVDQIKLCANLSMMFTEYGSLAKRYTMARECGVKAVEVGFPYDTPLKELVKAKESNGIYQVLINSFPGDIKRGELGFAAIPGRERDFENSLASTFEYAEGLNCSRIHFASGKLAEIQDLDLCYKTLKYNLSHALPLLMERGIVGLVEPINNYSVPNYIVNNFDRALDVVKSMDSKFIRLQLDIFHLQQIHGNLTRRITDILPYVGHIQIAQAPNRNEPDTPGEIDYQYIFDLLRKLKYTGWIGLEYIPATNTAEGLKWIKNFGLSL